MGVRGLTTYVAKNSDRYLVPHELKNCSLVIDGNSLASLLYNWHSKCICAFGGDYDKYAYCVLNFFCILSKCEVAPLVLFDGGYETKKLKTVMHRLRRKIMSAKNVTPTSQIKFFPLLMKEVFKDVLIDLNIPFVQCLFEADDEIAAIARRLNCPVLSYDSDFYVYDVLYIPFSTMSFEVSKRYIENIQKVEFYISCSIYHVDNFLDTFGGLHKSLIPLMATLLGNDFISRNVFKNFFSNYLKLQKKRSVSKTQIFIASLLHWLRSETLETATAKVLSTLKLRYRNLVSHKIRRAIEGYTQCDSDLLPYLALPINNEVPLLVGSAKVNVLCDLGNVETSCVDNASESVIETLDLNCSSESKSEIEDSEVDSTSNSNTEDRKSEDGDPEDGEAEDDAMDDIDLQDLTPVSAENLPPWFQDSFHHGNLPPCFMDMITRQTYYCAPQVEDYNLPFAHEISLPIISVIFRLLTADNEIEKPLLYYGRNKWHKPEKIFVNADNTMQTNFSPFATLGELPDEKRKAILFNTLELSDKDEKVLAGCPKDWQIFIITLLYWGRHCIQPTISNCHIHATLLSLVTLNVVDKQIGYYRSKKSFSKAFGYKLKIIRESKLKKKGGPFSNTVRVKKNTTITMDTDIEMKQVTDLLTVVTQDDCILVAETLLQYHQMNERLLDNGKLYSVTTVHAFAQLQSCLLHIMNLNALLNFPFVQCRTANFFSGTFIYNAYANLKKCADADAFTGIILGCGPSVRDVYNLLYLSVLSLLPGMNTVRKKCKKQRNCTHTRVSITRNKEKSSTSFENEFGCNHDEDDANFDDINNKFSVLAKITS